MTLLTKKELLNELSPPVHSFLATQLIDEYISLERRFVLGDWEPAELDGGQFCEILARIIYHLDSSNLNMNHGVDKCLSYLENGQNLHQLNPLKPYLHLSKVMRTIYKFRSDRGAVHISPTYTPNHMDSRMIIENVRWCFAETLRLLWNGDRTEVAEAIRCLLQFDTPCIGVYGDRSLVQRTDLSAEEEILILLHHAGEDGMSRNEIGNTVFSSPSTVTRTLARLKGTTFRQIIQNQDNTYRLTDLGAKRIREELSDKLRIH